MTCHFEGGGPVRVGGGAGLSRGRRVHGLVEHGRDVLGLVARGGAQDARLHRRAALAVKVVEHHVLRARQAGRPLLRRGQVEQRELQVRRLQRRVLGEVLALQGGAGVRGGRAGQAVEAADVAGEVGLILVHLHNVVHVAHLVHDGGLVRGVAPLAIHDELVLVHTRREQLHERVPRVRLLHRLPAVPVVKAALQLNVGAAAGPGQDDGQLVGLRRLRERDLAGLGAARAWRPAGAALQRKADRLRRVVQGRAGRAVGADVIAPARGHRVRPAPRRLDVACRRRPPTARGRRHPPRRSTRTRPNRAARLSVPHPATAGQEDRPRADTLVPGGISLLTAGRRSTAQRALIGRIDLFAWLRCR
mmetsp:Transcript_4377/g.10964  ORF Transcript_4377/g.10964 Transcript_4377/m.10964 type:complete len:361 (+) Transcript_4377:309-1391(+)